MAKTSPTPNQPRDPYTQHAKTLASVVQRLRGWIGTDASRAPELVDALNALVAHRLRGHAYAAAGTDAQEAVKRSADLLLAQGPIGPYTAAADAGRCGTAVIQLAAVQAGLDLAEPAGHTLASWEDLRAQLGVAGIDPPLEPVTVVRALSGSARAALAAGEVGTANAYADATLGWKAKITAPDDLGVDYVGLDVDRLVSDCRWAAGRAEESLIFARAARSAYDAIVADRLADPERRPPALVERLAEPLFGLYRDLADRLAAVGEQDLGLAVRRTSVERLRGLAARSEEPARLRLASALTDLGRDLLAQGRADEARAAADEASGLGRGSATGGRVRLLAGVVRARAAAQLREPDAGATLRHLLAQDADLAGPEAAAIAVATLGHLERGAGPAEIRSREDQALLDQARRVLSRGRERVGWQSLDATRAYGLVGVVAASPGLGDQQQAVQRGREREQAHREEAERRKQARQRRQRQADEAVAASRAEAERAASQQRAEQQRQRHVAERHAADERAEQQERKRRREARLREHEAEVARREREQRAARRDQIVSRLDELSAEVVTVDREQERDRLGAELAQLTQADPDAGVDEGEPGADQSEPSTDSPPDPEPGQAPEPEPEVDRSDPLDELGRAERDWASARATGTRRAARAAAERLVELLRPRAATDPDTNAAPLRAVLEELAGLRLRSGDIFGSRAATREARSLR